MQTCLVKLIGEHMRDYTIHPDNTAVLEADFERVRKIAREAVEEANDDWISAPAFSAH